jgi:hypothetical protein
MIKSYLTLSEKMLLVRHAIQAYLDGSEGLKDQLVVTDGNKMVADFVFNTTLTSLVGEELSEIDSDILSSHNVYTRLLEDVNGALEAKQYFEDAIKERNSIEFKIGEALEKLINKLPDSKDITKLSKSLVKDFTNPKNAEMFDRIKDLMDIKKKENL